MVSLVKTERSELLKHDFCDHILMDKCIETIKDKLLVNPKIKIFGKDAVQHRSIGFFSNTSIGYRYSNQLAASQKLDECMTKILDIINEKFDSNFNGILVNKYENGLDYIGAHSDDETNLDNSGVVAISYGEPRTFRIRVKDTKKIVLDFPTDSYSIIHMKGDFQKEFTHEIPVQKKVKNARYSFTFRNHKI